MPSEQEFDAIVIGSGLGGLAFASIMARLRKWRVLVLERHFKVGGLTHTFTRPGGWSWDIGLHYVGDMGEGMDGRRWFNFITGGQLKWNAMPGAYDIFSYPGVRFSVRAGGENFRGDLIAAFPEERSGIERYFRDLKFAMKWIQRRFTAVAAPPPISWTARLANGFTSNLPLGLTRQYLESRFTDPQLRAVLASQWANYGLPPGQSAFVTHAVIASHYLNGAWYPIGGSAGIAETAGIVIRSAGGDLLPNHEVTKILLDGNRAVGVEVHVKKGKEGSVAEFRAPVIVSDAGAWNTFAHLVPSAPLAFRDELKSPPEGFEVVELFLGLRRDPRVLGFKGENHWIFSSFDHDEMFARRDALLEGRAVMAYLSFPSLKDPQVRRHTAEIIAPFSYRSLETFHEEPWRRRGLDYDSAKQRITEALLNFIERHCQGFRDLVEYSELGTPLTFEHFTAAPCGAIYGYPGTPGRYRKSWLAPVTPIRNLYLTGSDAGMHGIMGALLGGVLAASRVLGPSGFLQIQRAARAQRLR